MSTLVTKATITGTALPSGALVTYFKDPNTSQVYAYKSTALGQTSYALLLPFPPPAFGGAFTNAQLLGSTAGAFTAVTAFKLAERMTRGTGYIALGTTPGGQGVYMGATNNLDLKLLGIPTVFAMRDITHYAYGLGLDAAATPYAYVHVPFGAVGIDVNKCISDASGIKNFGTYMTDTTVSILIDNINGNMAVVNLSTGVVTYIQLMITSGGEIVQFGNGYYISHNQYTDVYSLFNINNGGTFITDLDLGASGYDPTAACSFFDIL